LQNDAAAAIAWQQRFEETNCKKMELLDIQKVEQFSSNTLIVPSFYWQELVGGDQENFTADQLSSRKSVAIPQNTRKLSKQLTKICRPGKSRKAPKTT
jgi:hypothetical protein